MIITFLISIGFFISFNIAYADDILRDGTLPSFELIDRSSGLSNLSVSSVIQDRDGFIWFGTQGGLNRYDGRTFKVYSNDPFVASGLLHNLIQTMYYDPEAHEIWIGTYQGVSRYNIEKDTFENYTVESNGLTNPVVVAIEKDDEGMIWVGTLEGLNVIDPATKKLTTYEVPGNVVRDLLCDSQGTLWIGSYEGLLKFDRTLDQVVSSNFEFESKSVMVVNEFEEGILSIGLWDGGIADVNLGSGRIKTTKFDDNRVYSYIKTSDGTRWIGTWGGGLFAITAEGQYYQFNSDQGVNSLSHPIVYSMLQDDMGILWIGTNGGGINKVNPLKRNYLAYKHDSKDPNSLDAGKVNAILKDRSGNVWVAVYNEGLDKISKDKKTITKYEYTDGAPGSLTNANVVDIIETKSGDLLFATGNAVLKYDEKTDQFLRLVVFEDEVITYTLAEGKSGELWIGTYRDGLFKYDMETMQKSHYSFRSAEDFEISDNLIYDVYFDSQERLWVATNNGLNVLENGDENFHIYKLVSGNYLMPASNTFRVVFEDADHQIWIGTVGGGITKYNEDGTFTSYLERDGMPSNVVLGILQGTDGRLWLSTHNGLAILTPKTGDIFNLTPDDGIGGYEFNTGHFRDDSGTLYFGGLDGITAIPGNIGHGEIAPPKMYITGIDVFQRPYLDKTVYFNNQTLNFKQDETFLSFKFVALDYDSPEKVRYTYRLKGFDDRWIAAGTQTHATYSKLPPGDYTFEVFGETARGVKSEIVRVKLNIAKPWYATWTAYVVYTLLLSTLLYGLFNIWQSRVIQRRNAELASLNMKLEEVNAQLESLSIRDPLTNTYNRRYLATRLEEELNLAIRSGIEITLVMLDLDNFKEINDTYGHVYGDQFLIKMGDTLTKSLHRSTDFVVRYGGDEFLLVLFDTDKTDAMSLIRQIKNNVDEGSTVITAEGENIKTTCSVGVYSFVPRSGTGVTQVTKFADEALYTAKSKGKNQIIVFDELEG